MGKPPGKFPLHKMTLRRFFDRK